MPCPLFAVIRHFKFKRFVAFVLILILFNSREVVLIMPIVAFSIWFKWLGGRHAALELEGLG